MCDPTVYRRQDYSYLTRGSVDEAALIVGRCRSTRLSTAVVSEPNVVLRLIYLCVLAASFFVDGSAQGTARPAEPKTYEVIFHGLFSYFTLDYSRSSTISTPFRFRLSSLPD